MAVPARRLDEPPRRRPHHRPAGPAPRGRRPPARRPAPPPRPQRRPARRVPFLLFSLLVVGALVMGLAAGHALVAQSSFRIEELNRQVHELQTEHDTLRLRLAELSSPERIIRSARKQGLILPDRVEILAVRGRRATTSPRHTGTLAGAVLGAGG